MLNRKDMLGLIDASADEIYEILDTAAKMKKLLKEGNKKLPYLEGSVVFTSFNVLPHSLSLFLVV